MSEANEPEVMRSFADPTSMVGATAEQVAAMKPDGWLQVGFPDGRGGFELLAPGKLPGASGVVMWSPGTPGYRLFARRPSAEMFLLNEAYEAPLLQKLGRAWAGRNDGSLDAADVLELVPRLDRLLHRRRLRLWRQRIENDDAVRLSSRTARRVVADPMSWIRDEADLAVPPSEWLHRITLTRGGERRLARLVAREDEQ